MKKREDGRYAKQIMLGYKPNGSRKMKTVYGKTIKEVEMKEREIRNKIDEGIDVFNENMKVKEWATQWLSVYKTNVENGTYLMYENCVKNHIVPTIGNITLSQLKPIQIQSAINDIIAKGNTRTAQIYKVTITQIVKQAVAEDLMIKNVCENLEKIKRQKKEKRVLTDFEKKCIKLAEYADDERLFLDIMYYTGMRRGEVLALTVGDINKERMTISVNKSLDITNVKSRIKDTKSTAGNREIPIPTILFKQLMKYISNRKSLYLFTTAKGEMMSRSAFRRMWERIIQKTSDVAEKIKSEMNEYELIMLPDETISFSPHVFRHTYATSLYYAGIDLKKCQYLLGHSSVSITLEIYTHLDNINNNKSTEMINNFFNNQCQ